MAEINIFLNGYPPVVRLRIIQDSKADPGRIVVDFANDAEFKIEQVPRITYLVVDADGFSGRWNNIRLCKLPRARSGRVRAVFDDARWILKESQLFPRNWNDRDSGGEVMSTSRATTRQLVNYINVVTGGGVNIVPGSTPSFLPPARWAGRTAYDAMKELLEYTSCRLVCRPENSDFVFTSSGGSAPWLSSELYRPAPRCNLREIVFYSHPILYEREITATAAYLDEDTGAPVLLSSSARLPESPTEQYGQTRFRLWRPDEEWDDRDYIGYRVKSHTFDPLYPVHEAGRMIKDDFDPFPYHQPLVKGGSEIVDVINTSGGGDVFVTEHPILVANGNDFATNIKCLTGFYNRPKGKYDRYSYTATIDASANGVMNQIIPWIRPIDSDQEDVNPKKGVWEQIFPQVAEAIANKYRGPRGVVNSPKPMELGGSGGVGSVEYEFNLVPPHVMQRQAVLVNIDPGTEGNIR